MTQVLEIRSDDTAVIRTDGLYRVVTRDGKVIGELAPESEARAIAKTYNANRTKCEKKAGDRADIMDYRSALPHCFATLNREAEPDAYTHYPGEVIARSM